MHHKYREDKAAGKTSLKRISEDGVQVTVTESQSQSEVLTPTMIRANIAKWHNMIAESEAMLADIEAVPTLPKVVAVENL